MINILKGVRRQMHAAVLYEHDRRFAGMVLEMLRRNEELVIAENEPHLVQLTHYTVGGGRRAPVLPMVLGALVQERLHPVTILGNA
jgi:predicted N-formylglutamate amidohydrolase